MMANVFQFPVKPELILLYLTSATIAQNTTQPSQSEGNGLVGWQSNPAQRGTTNIIESCILTIIACTWTIHHPNVPSQKPKTMWGNFLHHLKWMTFTILVPEFILAQALDERLWVSRNWSILKRSNAKFDKHFASQRGPFDLTYEENCGWSKKHLYYANMGGFRINLTNDAEDFSWLKKHIYYANMGGFRIDLMSNTRSRNKATAIFPLTSGELIQYLGIKDSRSDQSPTTTEPTTTEPTTAEPTTAEPTTAEPTITEPTITEPTITEPTTAEPTTEPTITEPTTAEPTTEPTTAEPTRTEPTRTEPTRTEPTTTKVPELVEAPISEAHIDRMVKREAIAKTIAFLQILWILLSAIARAYLHHPISQLEIMTVAFATCAVITYIIRWNKPQNVEICIELPTTYEDLREFYEPYRFNFYMKSKKPNEYRVNRGPYFRNDTLRPYHVNRTFLPCLILFMVVIGLLHVLAWEFSFPSNVEKIMWRVASLASAGIPLLLLICSSLVSWLLVRISDFFMSESEKKQMLQKAEHFTTFCIFILNSIGGDASHECGQASGTGSGNTRGKVEQLKTLTDAMKPTDDNQENPEGSPNKPESYHDIFTPHILREMINFVYMNWNGFKSGNFGNIFRDNIDDFLGSLKELKEYLTTRGGIEQEILASYDNDSYKIDIFPGRTAKWRRREMGDNISRVAMPLITAFYTLARLIIIAVAFSSLRAMPAGVYETTWTSYLPKWD
ncbi:hypothetical protein F4774DRAFT_111073 [Daldinia eschscholtzii]|nr:hypothetical protein F4774DRAFT_111073 [Daldinia eschscholtzii]